MIRVTPTGPASSAPVRPRPGRGRFALPGAAATAAAAASAGATGLLGLQETPDQDAVAMQAASAALDALRDWQAQLLAGPGSGPPDPSALLAALEPFSVEPKRAGLAGVMAAIRFRAEIAALQMQRQSEPGG